MPIYPKSLIHLFSVAGLVVSVGSIHIGTAGTAEEPQFIIAQIEKTVSARRASGEISCTECPCVPSEPQVEFRRIAVQPGQTVEDAIQQAKQIPGAKIAEREVFGSLDTLATPPNDPIYTARQKGYIQRDIDIEALWKHETGSPNIIVAVLDTGIQTDPFGIVQHPELANSIQYNFSDPIGDADGDGNSDDDNNGCVDDFVGFDFVKNDGTPNPEGKNSDHGTAVASIIAARTNNNIGMAGIAGGNNAEQGIKIIPVKVCCTGSDSVATSSLPVAKGIRYAVMRGARVIQMSLGNIDEISKMAIEAVKFALDNGVIISVSSGNGKSGGGSIIHYTAEVWPAGWDPRVFRTGASDYAPPGYIASFSNGNNLLDVIAPGVNVTLCSFDGTCTYQGSGTSFSAPMTAGFIALALSGNLGLTIEQTKEAIRQSAHDINTGDVFLNGPDPLYGNGLINGKTFVEKLCAEGWWSDENCNP